MEPIIIIAEANFLQKDLYDLYIGKREFTVLEWRNICNRLQSIRDEARKYQTELNNESFPGYGHGI